MKHHPMKHDDPARHLLRAKDIPGLVRSLSGPTGMARMRLEQRAVPVSAELTLSGPAGAEGFVYVLEGLGRIGCGAEHFEIGPGDFLGLAPGDRPVVGNAGSTLLTLLVGYRTDRG